MQNIVFEDGGHGLGIQIGHCEICGGKEFGIDKHDGRVYVYCKNCGEEVMECK